MAKTIPVSQVVTINPGVIGTGGNPLALNGVFVSTNADIPVGQIMQFYSADAVAEYFGTDSQLAVLANNYFLSFDNSQKKPQSIIFSPYITSASSAWIRGTSLAGMTLAQLQAITGNLAVTVNGTDYSTTDALDLSTAESFSAAGAVIAEALGAEGVINITWDAARSAFRVTAVSTGAQSTISAMTGTAANALGLAAGMVSQGADPDTPTTAMNRIKELSLNWATFTVVEKVTDEVLADFAAWTNFQNRRYLMVAWDNNPLALVQDSNCFGQKCRQMQWEAVLPVWDNPNFAAMVMGSFASIDWNAYNGRIDIAFKSQSGLATTCNNLQDASVLLDNGYTYYGAYAASGENNNYNFIYRGELPGSDYGFADSYVNQIFLNSQLQLAVVSGLTGVRSVPYNEEGKTLIRMWCGNPITQALDNGTIRTGVTVGQDQKAQIIAAIGFDVTTELETQGYYLHIADASVQTRGQRQSPPITFLYMDGGSMQQITINSIVVL